MQTSLSGGRAGLLSSRALALLAGSAVVAVIAGVALAAPSTKNYGAAIAQTGQQTYSFTLTNLQSSTQNIGSANVTFPSAFSVTAASVTSVPSGKTWTAAVNGQIVELRAADKNSPLLPNQSLTVQVTATAACGAGYAVDVRVKQSNSFSGPPGNDFLGPNPLLLDVVGPAASFQFATITSPKVVGTPFNATVTAKDACGNDAVYYGGSPTLSGLNSTASASPTYGALSFSNGTATAAVTAVRTQTAATLTATDGSVTGTSNTFDVVTRLCHPSDSECSASHEDGTIVTTPVPPTGGAMELSLSGPGNSFACGGTTYSNVGSRVIVNPTGYAENIPVTIQWSLATAPPGARVVCISKDGGLTYFAVPSCSKTSPVPPCESSRTRSGSLITVTILIAPNDPIFDLG